MRGVDPTHLSNPKPQPTNLETLAWYPTAQNLNPDSALQVGMAILCAVSIRPIAFPAAPCSPLPCPPQMPHDFPPLIDSCITQLKAQEHAKICDSPRPEALTLHPA